MDAVKDIAQNLREELKALSPRPLPVTVLGVLKKYDLNSPIVATEVIRLAGLVRKETGWYFEDEIQERITAEGDKEDG